MLGTPSASARTWSESIHGCDSTFLDTNRQASTMIKIKDLAESKELDQKAMSRISGGAIASSYRTDGSSTGRLSVDWGQHKPASDDTSSPDYGAALNRLLLQPNT